MKFKATLIILAIFATIAVCYCSCSSRKKHVEKYDSLSYAKEINVEQSESKLTGSLKAVSITQRTDSGTVKTTIIPKGVFTFSNGSFTGEAESINISHSYIGKTLSKDSIDQSIVSDKKSLKSQEKEKKEEVKKKSLDKEVDNTHGKIIGISILILSVIIALWFIKRQITAIKYLGS